MPYERISELPDSVKDNLPKHGQEIYRKAHNNALEQYNGDEARAHRVAWGAVKQEYEKDKETGKWKRKKWAQAGIVRLRCLPQRHC